MAVMVFFGRWAEGVLCSAGKALVGSSVTVVGFEWASATLKGAPVEGRGARISIFGPASRAVSTRAARPRGAAQRRRDPVPPLGAKGLKTGVTPSLGQAVARRGLGSQRLLVLNRILEPGPDARILRAAKLGMPVKIAKKIASPR